jgi:hypothetical protein
VCVGGGAGERGGGLEAQQQHYVPHNYEHSADF